MLEQFNISGPISKIGKDSFFNTGITELDLSDSISCDVDESVFGEKINVKMPFYAV
jgi:hypothetical protein